MKKPNQNLFVGTLDLLILRVLGKGSEMHGFGILEWIDSSTKGALILEEGALYHSLHRMEKRGLLEPRWGISEKGRKAKYYRLTPRGAEVLKEKEEGWKTYVETVASIVPPEAPEGA